MAVICGSIARSLGSSNRVWQLSMMAGAMARARVLGVPVILDGFIACSAAAILHVLAPTALDHCVAGHASAETAHTRLLTALNKSPLLSLGLRLGEGSGAALAWPLLQSACSILRDMASFESAGVSEKSDSAPATVA